MKISHWRSDVVEHCMPISNSIQQHIQYIEWCIAPCSCKVDLPWNFHFPCSPSSDTIHFPYSETCFKRTCCNNLLYSLYVLYCSGGCVWYGWVRPHGPYLESDLWWVQSLGALRADSFVCTVFSMLSLRWRRGSTKGNLLTVAAALPHASIFTASVHSHSVRCDHVCLCARDTVLVNLVSKRMFTRLYGR